jgi:broad specificity phosphatase PhoE
MTAVRLVRHGHAAAGFGAEADPGLDDRGRSQATAMAEVVGPLGPLPLVTSPLRRTRETAAALEAVWGTTARVDPRVAEIPTPTRDLTERSAWLSRAMAGTWADLGPELEAWRDQLVGAVAELTVDTVVVTHFVAINAVVGWCRGDDRVMAVALDNCSVTTLDVAPTGSVVVRELGATAATEVR